MTVYVAICPVGLFAIDEKNNILGKVLFPKDSEYIAKAIEDFERGEQIPELIELIETLYKKGIKDIETKQPNPASKYLSENFRTIAIKEGWAKDAAELNMIISRIAIAKSKEKISKLERKDKVIVQVTSAIEDLDKILNLMDERLHEWYGLHYPELKVSTREKFVNMIISYGRRENMPNFKSSMGMDLSDTDIEALKEYAKNLSEMLKLKERLDKYLSDLCKAVMPNTTAVIGYRIAAKLLAHAGSLERLAKMSSSTLQLLGAERALFTFLKAKGKKGAKPPKYGIIYLVPEISGAPKEKRGKIARIYASELVVAVRTDYFSKVDRSQEILKSLKEKLEKIK